MLKKITQSIVIILGILIILAFLALIYGMYSKISISEKNTKDLALNFSAHLKNHENIKNIEVFNKDKLLIVIESNEKIRGLIYDFNNDTIIGSIDR
jgi:hypothetical protein